MATVKHELIHTGVNLNGGQSVFISVPGNRGSVYALSVEPLDAQNNSLLDYKVEVRNVRYYITGGPVGAEKFHINFEVHNWGNAWCNYRVRCAEISA